MSSAELYEEIGRLKQRVDDLRAGIGGLKDDNETLNLANLEMHRKLAAANENVRWLKERLQAREEEIKQLRDQLTRTPSRHNELALRPRADFSRPPPPFNLPQPAPFPTYPPQNVAQSMHFASPSQPSPQSRAYHEQQVSQSGYLPPPANTQTPYPAQHMYDSEYHQWRPTRPGYVTEHQSSQPSMSRSSILPARMPPTTPPYQTQGALIRPSQQQRFATPSSTLVNLRAQEGLVSLLHDISPLFHRGEEWAKRYCSIPSKARDDNMPINLRERIMYLTNSQEAPILLSQTSTRPLIVAKMINYEITQVCLRPSLIDGFRPSVDLELRNIRRQNTPGMANHVRRGILNSAAEIIQNATANPRFEPWVDREAGEQNAKLWSKLGALVVATTNGSEAREALKEVWRDAYRVGVKMACKPSIFSADFPAVGHYFNPATMVNKDPEVVMSGVQLASMGAIVRLAVTPAVTEWDYMGMDPQQRVLHFSNCLLAFPQKSGAMVLSQRR